MPKKKIEKTKRFETKNQTLLNQIIQQITQSTTQIFACYIPGQINSKLFVFRDEKAENDVLHLIKELKEDIKTKLLKSRNVDNKNLLIIANLLSEIKEYNLAMDIYKQIVAIDPDNIFCWSNILTISLKQGNISRALESYLYLPPYFIQNSIKEQLDPKLNGYRILNIRFSSSLPSKIHDIGQRLFESSITDDDFSNELRILLSDEDFCRGVELFNNDEYDSAFILFSNTIEDYPDSHILHFLLAESAIKGKHYLIAEEYYKKAIQLKNNIPEYWFSLAFCFKAQYKTEQALKALKTAIWSIAVVVGLNNAGYDVGALLAGLGLGGLAFAMAAKDSVANLFGGITVFIDTKDDLKKGALGSIRRQLKLSRYQVVQCLKVLYWPRWLLSRNFREKV